MSSAILPIMIIYFIILIVIGIIASRRIKTESDFFVAGKKLNYWVVAFSSRATGESAWLMMGLTGMGFAIGLPALWVAFGEVMGVTFAWVFMSQRFKSETDKYNAITIPDYLEARFNDNKHILRWISAIILSVMVTLYVAAQLKATGDAFNNFLGWNFLTGVIVGLVLVVGYTVAGGFFAVCWTDLLQGILMFAGLIALPLIAFLTVSHKYSNLAEIFKAISLIHPETVVNKGKELHLFGGQALLSVWPKTGTFSVPDILEAIGLWGIGLAFMGSPQVFVRFISIKSKKELVKGSLVAVLFTIFTDLGAIFAGLFGRLIFTGIHQEEIYSKLAGLFPPAITGLFMAILLAAIMSTADSLLILASSAVVRDIYHKIYNPNANEKKLTAMSRYITLFLGLAAFLVAVFYPPSLVFWFVLIGWGGIGAGFCPTIILSLFWKKTTRAGVIAGMLTGFFSVILWKIAGLSNYLYELVPGFFLSFIVIIIVSLLTYSRD